MEGVTGMMARLGHVPGCSRGGLYGPANIDFRFVMQLRLQRADRGEKWSVGDGTRYRYSMVNVRFVRLGLRPGRGSCRWDRRAGPGTEPVRARVGDMKRE